MFTEDELLPISALQHFVYCRRQAALIHIERAWEDNVLTVEGTHLHETVDHGPRESRGPLKILRSVPLASFRVGLAGKADVVELHEAGGANDAAVIGGRRWHVRPVEYKRGKAKRSREDEVQLCAQALCLEEMLGVVITEGDLFYGTTRRRKPIRFDESLRALTESTAGRMRELFASGKTPPAEPGPKCRKCSLLEICRPYAAERSARRYLRALYRSAAEAS
jgi:CRISPR-associated exonuclease Cas4